jgi:ABC-2 type transport system permease protein
LHPAGLALRPQRGSLGGWSIGLFCGGVSYGSIGSDIEDFVGDDETPADLLAQAGGRVTDSIFATTLMILALAGSGFAIQSTMRLRTEETAGRAEPLLAAALSRPRWAASHLTLALGGSVVMLVAAGLGVGVAYGVTTLL